MSILNTLISESSTAMQPMIKSPWIALMRFSSTTLVLSAVSFPTMSLSWFVATITPDEARVKGLCKISLHLTYSQSLVWRRCGKFQHRCRIRHLPNFRVISSIISFIGSLPTELSAMFLEVFHSHLLLIFDSSNRNCLPWTHCHQKYSSSRVIHWPWSRCFYLYLGLAGPNQSQLVLFLPSSGFLQREFVNNQDDMPLVTSTRVRTLRSLDLVSSPWPTPPLVASLSTTRFSSSESTNSISYWSLLIFRNGGVGMAMYNTTDSIYDFARSCMSFAYEKGEDLYFTTKNTILKQVMILTFPNFMAHEVSTMDILWTSLPRFTRTRAGRPSSSPST